MPARTESVARIRVTLGSTVVSVAIMSGGTGIFAISAV